MDQHIRHFLDVLAAGGALASFFGLLQPLLAVIASTLSIIWLSMQLYDRHQRRLADKLTAKE
jgi:hypothetical protein